MLRIDERVVRARPATCFLVAADVEHWPELLPHYRRVRFHRKDGFGRGRVEMAAWRRFGPLRYPTWWVSEMESDRMEPIVRYRHVDGITRGMDVRWEFLPHRDGSRVRIVHEWVGPTRRTPQAPTDRTDVHDAQHRCPPRRPRRHHRPRPHHRFGRGRP
ncbi:MAG: SRPBCC family protein [Gemmatimonadota bacterium]